MPNALVETCTAETSMGNGEGGVAMQQFNAKISLWMNMDDMIWYGQGHKL